MAIGAIAAGIIAQGWLGAMSGRGDGKYRRPVEPYEPTEDELGILGLLEGDIKDRFSASDTDLEGRMDTYLNAILSDNILSQEEESLFDQQYDLELGALQEKYDMEMERQGASTMADLVSRGVLETTTGFDTIAEQNRRFTESLSSDTSSLLQQKQYDRNNFENMKRQMAQTGYNLTNKILQTRRMSDASSAGRLQDFYTTEAISTVGQKVNDMLQSQAWNQYQHNQRQANLSTSVGIASAFL